MENRVAFQSFSLGDGEIDYSIGDFPTIVSSWVGTPCAFDDGATHFGYVYEGPCRLESAAGSYRLQAGMYFSAPGLVRIIGGSGIAMSRVNYAGLFMIGGPVEERGRLNYIDGCTDTLLISPVVQGDACLNLLHIPPNTEQSEHTHPSLRAGMIIGGEGHCVTPDGRFELSPGLCFVIPPDGLHSFHTADSALRVIAYHPDSDFGPTHEDHPMLNRTYLSGRAGE